MNRVPKETGASEAPRLQSKQRYGDCNPTEAVRRAQPDGIRRLRLIARCLSLSPVFISDYPLHAELFDARGAHVESWVWR